MPKKRFSAIAGFGVLVFFFGMAEAFIKKRVAGNNPWGVGARTHSRYSRDF